MDKGDKIQISKVSLLFSLDPNIKKMMNLEKYNETKSQNLDLSNSVRNMFLKIEKEKEKKTDQVKSFDKISWNSILKHDIIKSYIIFKNKPSKKMFIKALKVR